jgi:hypothetical protein
MTSFFDLWKKWNGCCTFEELPCNFGVSKSSNMNSDSEISLGSVKGEYGENHVDYIIT